MKAIGLIIVSLAFAALSCANPSLTARAARDVTYAPSLSYLSTKKDVQPAMRRMATAVMELHQALSTPEIGPEEQARIFAWLNEIETAAESLVRPGSTNHPKLDRNLDRFMRDIEAARRGANATPPNYFMAGSLSGSCMYCHSTEVPSDYRASYEWNSGQ